MFNRFLLGPIALVLGLAVPARADNFLLRGFTWFGFLSGKEIRETCAPGVPDRVRFVYNAVYHEQIRVYEFERPAVGAPAVLRARLPSKPDFQNLGIGELFLGSRDRMSEAVLDPASAEALLGTLIADGWTDKVPDGLTLPSDGFYWIVSGCLDGRPDIQGWVDPTPRFKALRFPALLFAQDRTGVPVNKPRPVDAGERMRARSGNQSALDTQPAFDIRLNDDGIVGRVPNF